MKVEKVNYLVFDGKKYEAVEQEEHISGACDGCCFLTLGGECTMPDTAGFSISCDDSIFVEEGEVAAQQRLTEQSEEEAKEDRKELEGKAAAQQQLTEQSEERKPGIGKRSYYGFPNGVEAEDICRYLSFNLGNVVKYSCRAGRKDPTKKIEDLMKARYYLDNEIKRLEKGNE